MKIEIFVATAHNGTDSGCGVICIATDNIEHKCRRYGYALGCSDRKLASIKSIMVALGSVRLGFRDEEVELYIKDDYIARLIEYSGSTYKIEPEEYIDDVKKMRKILSTYSNIGINGKSPRFDETYVLAETSMNTQLNSDTFTFNFNP